MGDMSRQRIIKILIPLLTLIAGFILALLAAGVHSMFFCLLPVLAFIPGYFLSKWQGC